jgi:murein L,D-transpeptidase YcbB/YkuD
MRDRPEWTPEKITAAMNAGREQAVPLKEHLPVHIGYFTAWVNPDGSVTYTDDPYALDERQKLLSAEGSKGSKGSMGSVGPVQ